MRERNVRLTAIALLLAAAAFFVVLVFAGEAGNSPATVTAHPCATATPPDMHLDFQAKSVPCSTPTHQKTHAHTIEVDGGRDRELVFKTYVPSNIDAFDDAMDSVVITFHRSFDLPDSLTLTKPGPTPSDPIPLITIVKNESAATVDITNPANASPNDLLKQLTLTGATNFTGDNVLTSGDFITITIKAGAGIETPETPQGFDDFEGEEPYEVSIKFVDGTPPNGEVKSADKNYVIVKNPIDSTVPNTSVRIELHTHAEEIISTADDISVDFSGPSADSGFDLPSTMATSRIKVFYKEDKEDSELKKSFNPSEVQIEGERVIFSVPFEKEETITFEGDYRIEFSKLARVKTPLSAGLKTIRVLSSVDGDEEDIIEAVVRRTTTVSPKGGPRGSEFTLEGKGYASGTVTVYHDANPDDPDKTIDAGETLASVKTVRGAFRTKLTALGNPGEAKYVIRARDSEGDEVSVEFDIRSAMSFEPNPVGFGSSLKIIISDWEAERNEVVAAQIAGEEVFIADAVEYENCIEHPDAANRDSRGEIILTVNVPSDIPPGEQTVAVYDHSQLDYTNAEGQPIENKKSCYELDLSKEPRGAFKEELTQAIITDDPIAITKATVEIVARSLTLSQSEAVRGQRITITGGGFSAASTGIGGIDGVTINGIEVEEDVGRFEVSTNGDFAVMVTVPVGVADGENEIRVKGKERDLAQGTLTITEASITVEPAEGIRGAQGRISGSGFIARQLVRLTYGFGGGLASGDTPIGTVLANASGEFSTTFRVPLNARIGREHTITALAETNEDGDTISVRAEAVHSVPGGSITVTPGSALPGDTIIVRGENLPPFALVRPVRIDNLDVTPVPNVSTERDGSFEAAVVVPQIELGDHTLRVEVSGAVLTLVVSIAPPPRSGPTERVLGELISSGALVRAWRLNREDQTWTLFDPREEFAEFNTLTEVNSGDFVWINLNEPRSFQGDTLAAGWNIVLLK